jgi:tRNA(Ile)-lysidine synthase
VDQPVAVGLSGGGDSLALMLLVRTWADAHGRQLLAFTVDHGLNPDSARWTAFAGEAAATAGVQWRALAWRGEKPTTGLPAAARSARQRLLAEAAREAGACVILLGHTADDVAEGALMRERDAPALGGLREWSPSPVWPEGRGVFLLRPLLQAGRAELRDWLTEHGRAWLDDPANEDPRFARARARRRLREAPLPPPAVGNKEGIPREQAGTWRVTPDGRIVAERPLGARFVSAALLCAGGGETPPRGERLTRLVDRLAAGEVFTASLAGARVTASPDEVTFGREAGERLRGGLAPVVLEPGRTVVWDGRYEVTAVEAGWRVEALAGRVGALAKAERAWLKALPPAARSALPVLVSDRGVALPQPFAQGPAVAKSLVRARLDAACGLLDKEDWRPS